MKFIVDRQLPPWLALWLSRQDGCEATHVNDMGLQEASDRVIARLAVRDDLIIVSKDGDFRLLMSIHGFSLLWIRCGNVGNARFNAILNANWVGIDALLKRGVRLIEVR